MMAGALATVVLALLVQAPEPPASGDPCALAPKLRDALQQRFGTSRVLKAADLFEDERALFKADRPGACPGVAHGRFFSVKERPAIALVLLDVESTKNIRLVVARPALNAWTFHEVEELETGSTPVVSAKRSELPAEKAVAKSRSTVGAADTLVLTGYESWQRVYVWNGRKFEALPSRD